MLPRPLPNFEIKNQIEQNELMIRMKLNLMEFILEIIYLTQ